MRLKYEIYKSRLNQRVQVIENNDTSTYQKMVLKIRDDLREYQMVMEDLTMDILNLKVDQYEYIMDLEDIED